MARYIFQGTFRDGQGNIVSGGTITVYLAGTDTTATIYEDDTTVTSTSYVESDDNGYFIFYIDSSDYSASQFFDIQLAKSGYTTKLYPSISIVPLGPTDETIEVTDNTTNDVSASAHGWTPKLSDSASDFLDGKGNWDAVSDADLEVTDVTTNNASTSAHGFLKKLDNESTHFMDGTGAWDTVKDSDLVLTDITDNDVSTTKHGFVPKLPDDSAQFLNGTGNWATPGGSASSLPTGGSTGQVLAKTTEADYDAGWITPANTGKLGMAIFGSSGTFTFPAGTTPNTVFKFTITGGGAGSYWGTNNYSIGGGAGATTIVLLSGFTAGQYINVTVGAGGGYAVHGGASYISSGSASITMVSASGGYHNGVGGSGSNGHIHIPGGYGKGIGNYNEGLIGGNSVYGSWPAYGAGGSYNTTDGNGRGGQQGVVVVEWVL